MANYYVFIDRQYGPYEISTLEELLSSRRFSRECWVFHQGETEDWTRAGEVESLKKLFQKSRITSSPSLQVGIQLSEKKPMLETLLISPSKADAMRPLQTRIPAAPLSDLPSSSGVVDSRGRDLRPGIFQKIKKLLRME